MAFFWLRVDGNQASPNSKPDGFAGKSVEIGGNLLISNDKAEDLYTSITVKKALENRRKALICRLFRWKTITVKVYQIPDGNEDAKIEWNTN